MANSLSGQSCCWEKPDYRDTHGIGCLVLQRIIITYAFKAHYLGHIKFFPLFKWRMHCPLILLKFIYRKEILSWFPFFFIFNPALFMIFCFHYVTQLSNIILQTHLPEKAISVIFPPSKTQIYLLCAFNELKTQPQIYWFDIHQKLLQHKERVTIKQTIFFVISIVLMQTPFL